LHGAIPEQAAKAAVALIIPPLPARQETDTAIEHCDD
jgi:hypothetical protein